MGITASPLPTDAPALLRRADAGTICGVEVVPQSSLVSCSGASTCAVTTNTVEGKRYAGCHSAGGTVIPTSCSDLGTPCASCVQPPGVLVCAGNYYCATQWWYHSSTHSDDKPYATSYYCNIGESQGLTGTYLPAEYGAWNQVTETGAAVGQKASSHPGTSGPTSTEASGSSNTDSSVNPSNSPADAPAALSPKAIGLIAASSVLFITIVIGAFILLKRRRRADAAAPLAQAPAAHRDSSQELTQLEPDSSPATGNSYPLVKEEHGFTQQFPQAPEQTYYAPKEPSSYSASAENGDTLGGLPDVDDMRRLRTMGGARGAPSVMTDMSETLTIGGDGEVDDIHAIGHER